MYYYGSDRTRTYERRRLLFDWDDANRLHVRDASVEPEEAEEAVQDPRRVGAAAYNVGMERRWALLGSTEAGRVLLVIFTRRRGQVRVISARIAEKDELKRYRRRGK